MSVNIEIVREDHVEVTREATRVEWDADDIAHSHSIEGYVVVPKKAYWDFVLNEDPDNKTLYLIYTLYNTGDSFHYEENAICLVGLYEHKEDAVAVMRAIENDYKKSKDSFDPLKITLPKAGRVDTIGVSTWKGYFERLNEVCIELVEPVGERRVRF